MLARILSNEYVLLLNFLMLMFFSLHRVWRKRISLAKIWSLPLSAHMPLCSSSKVAGRRRGIFVEGKRYRGSSSSYGRAHTRSVCRALLQFKLKSNCLIEWKGSDLSQEPRVILCPQLCHLIEEVIDVFILRLNLSVWPKVFFKKLGS